MQPPLPLLLDETGSHTIPKRKNNIKMTAITVTAKRVLKSLHLLLAFVIEVFNFAT